MAFTHRITAVERTRRGRFSIFADGEFLFSVDAETLAKSGLAEGDEVSEAEIADLRPGEPLVLSRCAAAVSGLAGVADVVITAPAANVQPTDLQWCRLGTLTLEAL